MAEDKLSVRRDQAYAPSDALAPSDTSDSPLKKLIRSSYWSHPLVLWVVLLFSMAVLYVAISTPLTLRQQAYMSVASLIAAFWVRRYDGHIVTLMLILFSLVSSGRYIFWRLTDTLGIGDPLVSTLDLTFTFGLIAAELYALLVLVIGYFQVLWPMRRKPTALPENISEWPVVDVYIPTYNEPLSVVSPTILAASDIDWPSDKLNIYVLDDGGREEFAQFAQEAGVHYIARSGSEHAKAGNINNALKQTQGDLITIFDADHIPTRSFLQVAVGGFLTDPKLALVQTPHHFFSPDPFERNLGTFRKVPNEGELFYGLLQDGNDFWDATFFCGSCAVLRRTALDQIGGVAVETVTEDAHTSLKMHRKGWHSAYINIPQAAGLATESLSSHIAQRTRWARGMAQIFRVDNPLLGKGLRLGQRLCYANAMLHFFYGLPRFVFLTAPLGYLFLEAHIFQAWAALIAVYLVPHLVVANVTNSRIQGSFRHSFWAETYETVLAWYIMRPTLLAVINPKFGKFNVTDKGGIVEKEYIDFDIAKPYVILLLLNMLGFLVGIFRLFFWNSHEIETVVLNMLWTVYNCFMLGAAVAVAREHRQVRRSTRVETELGAYVQTSNRKLIQATTLDISQGGAMLNWHENSNVQEGETIHVALMPEEKEVYLPATVIAVNNKQLRLEFQELNMQQRRHLIYVSFGRADAWMNWREDRKLDSASRSAIKVMGYGWQGIISVFGIGGSALRNIAPRGKSKNSDTLGGAKTAMLAIAIASAAVFVGTDVQALDVKRIVKDSNQTQEPSAESIINGTTEHKISLQDLGALESVRLQGVDARYSVPFSVRTDQVISKASLNLNFAHSKALIYRLSALNVLVNNELVESIPLNNTTADGVNREISIDPRLFVDYNQVTFQFVGHYTLDCEDQLNTALWALISNKSSLQFTAESLSVANELALLPTPFFDKRDTSKLSLPFVFPGAPDNQTLEAAGILASWFGGLAKYRGASFPTSINDLPTGNAVVFMTGDRNLDGISSPRGTGTRVAMVENPRNPNAKLLLIAGADGAALINAARALALGEIALSGASAQVLKIELPPKREPYDAPRWIPSDQPVQFGSFSDPGTLQMEGYNATPIEIDLALAPDLFTWDTKGVPVHLKYRFTPPNEVGNSTLNIGVNETFIRGLELKADQLKPGKLGMNDTAEQEADVYLPGYELAGLSQLNARFHFAQPSTECRRLTQNMVGAISPESTIDLSSFPHYTTLPDLSKFTDSGFPYTRLADLSETVVVLPSKPGVAAIDAYLTVMGRMGRHTGYPATRISVNAGGNSTNLDNKDIILIGTQATLPLLEQWQNHMPLSLGESQVRLRTLGMVDQVTSWFGDRDLAAARTHAGEILSQSSGDLGSIVGFESPLTSERSVVAIFANQPAQLPQVAELLQDPGDAQFIQGDLALLNDDAVNYYRLGDTYTVGSLPLLTRLHLFFSKHPILLLISALIVILLLAILIYRALRSSAKRRIAED